MLLSYITEIQLPKDCAWALHRTSKKKCNIIHCLRKIQSVESEEKLHKNEITLCMLPFWCSQSKISDFMLSWLYMYMHNF